MTTRLPDITPSPADDDQRELLRRFTGGERAARADFSLVDDRGRLTGPPATWLLSPSLGLALEPLAREIRFGLSLPRRLQEVVILTVARIEDSPFERYAHIRAARGAGLSDAEIDALLAGPATDLLEDRAERAAVALAERLLTSTALDDASYATAAEPFSPAELFELVTLVGYYRMIAIQLRAFDILPPSGR